MRSLLKCLAIVIVLAALYVGSAAYSVKRLIDDVNSDNAAAVMTLVDVPRLRSSLSTQLLQAYYHQVEQTRRIRAVERMLAPTVVDALVAELLTAKNLSSILTTGKVKVTVKDVVGLSLPPLSTSGLENINTFLNRIRPVSPMQIQLYLASDKQSAIRLHYAGTHWMLSGIDLPQQTLDKLISQLPRT